MKLGYATMNNLHEGRPEELARALEERRFDSLWIGEHPQLPSAPRFPYPRGGELPLAYRHMADPFISLALAAAATTSLKLALGVVLVLEREIFSTAKAISTLDHACGGRLLVGVGVGWNRDEFETAAPMPWNRRYAGLREYVGAMRELWCRDVSSFDGEWIKFDRVWSYPKPLQRPHPPIYAGVSGPLGMRHAIEWGDVWCPIETGPEAFEPKLKAFRAALHECGRDPDSVPITVIAFSDPAEEDLARYRDFGVERVVLTGGPQDRPNVLRRLDQFARITDVIR